MKVVKYLKGTQSYGLVYEKSDTVEPVQLSIYSDASFADDKEDRVSTSGFVVLLNGTAVTWKSSKQKIVALSSTEAEYIALTESVKETKWLSMLLSQLEVKVATPIKVFEDNESAIKLTRNSVFHARTKHIEVRYHFIRQEVMSGLVNVLNCNTKDMIADAMTKPLPRVQFEKLRQLSGLI